MGYRNYYPSSLRDVSQTGLLFWEHTYKNKTAKNVHRNQSKAQIITVQILK